MEKYRGVIALAVLIVGLFGWLKWDIRGLRDEINLLRRDVAGLGERVARIEGALFHSERVSSEK